jgi:uncharacterized protein YcfJ
MTSDVTLAAAKWAIQTSMQSTVKIVMPASLVTVTRRPLFNRTRSVCQSVVGEVTGSTAGVACGTGTGLHDASRAVAAGVVLLNNHTKTNVKTRMMARRVKR